LSRLKWLIVAVILACIVAFFLIRGLGSSPQLSADAFAEVYVRLSIAADTLSSDSAKFEQERSRILKEAGVTQGEMDEFVRRLDKKPLEWADVWKKIVEKLERRREQVKSP
jgi:hypothetical protein